jgi:hypothetical protein
MRTFFGLTSDYIKDVYEQMFFMNYTGNWSITELYNLPVGLRRWFIGRTIKQKEAEREAVEKATNKSR